MPSYRGIGVGGAVGPVVVVVVVVVVGRGGGIF
jgi:hypothetical protein